MEMEKAALKIQAGFRGFKARKQIKYLKLFMSFLWLLTDKLLSLVCSDRPLVTIQLLSAFLCFVY